MRTSQSSRKELEYAGLFMLHFAERLLTKTLRAQVEYQRKCFGFVACSSKSSGRALSRFCVENRRAAKARNDFGTCGRELEKILVDLEGIFGRYLKEFRKSRLDSFRPQQSSHNFQNTRHIDIRTQISICTLITLNVRLRVGDLEYFCCTSQFDGNFTSLSVSPFLLFLHIALFQMTIALHFALFVSYISLKLKINRYCNC